MPQMKPMNWMFLFFLLNFSLLIMNIKNFFFFFNMMNITNKKKLNNKNFKNWNW